MATKASPGKIFNLIFRKGKMAILVAKANENETELKAFKFAEVFIFFSAT